MHIATVSGSFHRHMSAIYEAVGTLRDAGVIVLSPADPRVVDYEGEFLYVASDKFRSVRLVQDRHLECIRSSSFLWLVAPDGYVGPSAAMEIACAVGAGTPVFSEHQVADLTMRQYVTKVAGVSDVLNRLLDHHSHDIPNVLVAPDHVIAQAHYYIDRLRPDLLGQSQAGAEAIEQNLRNTRDFLIQAFGIK